MHSGEEFLEVLDGGSLVVRICVAISKQFLDKWIPAVICNCSAAAAASHNQA